jgi:hypothetical protein
MRRLAAAFRGKFGFPARDCGDVLVCPRSLLERSPLVLDPGLSRRHDHRYGILSLSTLSRSERHAREARLSRTCARYAGFVCLLLGTGKRTCRLRDVQTGSTQACSLLIHPPFDEDCIILVRQLFDQTELFCPQIGKQFSLDGTISLFAATVVLTPVSRAWAWSSCARPGIGPGDRPRSYRCGVNCSEAIFPLHSTSDKVTEPVGLFREGDEV